MTEKQAPLQGLIVLELGQLIAGPYCGQLLADMGARVIKIEAPGSGDAIRSWGQGGKPVWFCVIGRNKESVTLNMRSAKGQEIFKQLVLQADIIIENFLPGTMQKWQCDYDTISAINPKIIYASVSGFGQTGPYAKRGGYASVCEAMGGMRNLIGFADRPPARAGLSLGDTLAACFTFQGILVALYHREQTGQGQQIDTAITESVMAVTEAMLSEYTVSGHNRERSGTLLPGLAPSNIYPCADGEIIIAANQQTVFQRLAQAMQAPELLNDPRFVDHISRGKHQTEIDEIVGQWSATKTMAEIDALLRVSSVPAGPVYKASDVLNDKHFQQRQSFVYLDDEEFGSMAMPNVTPKLSKSPGKINHTGPKLGADTATVLRQLLNLSNEELAVLTNDGTV